MAFQYIKFQVINDNVAIITIDRPEVRNALNFKGWQELKEAIMSCEENQDIRTVIITGSGERAFISGTDINMMKDKAPLDALFNENQQIVNLLENVRVPTIAAVNGYALGSGFEIVLACDIVIASENARFGFPEAGLGIIPTAGGTQRLTKLIGKSRAMEMFFTGRIIDAHEACKLSLVNRITIPEQLIDEVTSIAKEILKKAPVALQIVKNMVNAAVSSDLQTGLLLEKMGQSILYGTADQVEGLAAFLEKRSPKFSGE